MKSNSSLGLLYARNSNGYKIKHQQKGNEKKNKKNDFVYCTYTSANEYKQIHSQLGENRQPDRFFKGLRRTVIELLKNTDKKLKRIMNHLISNDYEKYLIRINLLSRVCTIHDQYIQRWKIFNFSLNVLCGNTSGAFILMIYIGFTKQLEFIFR